MITLGLCMIVKNEAGILRRCLDSVRNFVDYVLVVDTGSTDGSQDIVASWLSANRIAGAVIQEPWQDFAINRTSALKHMREVGSVDYVLIMDADDWAVVDSLAVFLQFKQKMTADHYFVEVRNNSVAYWRPHILRNALPYHYRGVLHEFIVLPPEASGADADGLRIEARTEGARSKDPDKYSKDARALAAALQTEQDPFMRSRYTFYLGQSHYDAGQFDEARVAYGARADMGFWTEERYVSLYRMASILERQGRSFPDVLQAYLKAAELAPQRGEALCAAARLCRLQGEHRQGFDIAGRGVALAEPKGALFSESWVYQYGLLDEYAVNAYWSGAYQASLDACLQIFINGKCPGGDVERVRENARFARLKADPAWLQPSSP